jgi:hypothetical protein
MALVSYECTSKFENNNSGIDPGNQAKTRECKIAARSEVDSNILLVYASLATISQRSVD